MELIDNTPPCMYFTWHNEIDNYLDREGKEGELIDRIMGTCNRNGKNLKDILDDVNCAYRNCTEIFLCTHPDYTYDCSYVGGEHLPFEKGYYEQFITYILLFCQPKQKKTKRIDSLLQKMNYRLWGDGDQTDDFDQELLSVFNNDYFAETDIDFSPNPDMAAVRKYLEGSPDMAKLTNGYDYKKVEFLINLMRTKEDKLMQLDCIDKAYRKPHADAVDDLPF